MRRDDLEARVAPLLGPGALWGKGVAVIGLGSGGSLVAWWLAAAGVGHLVLVDPDRLEAANVWRHLVGTEGLGRLKVEAVRDRLVGVSPEAKVEAFGLDVTSPEGRGVVRPPLDLAVVATDTVESRIAVAEACLEGGIPAVYGGCFDRAAMGEVLWTAPGRACFGCIARAVQDLDTGAPRPQADYGVIDGGPTVRQASPGLACQVASIASIQAQVAIRVLLTGQGVMPPPGPNYLLIGNEPVPGLLPRSFDRLTMEVARRSDCPLCGLGRATAEEGEALLAGVREG